MSSEKARSKRTLSSRLSVKAARFKRDDVHEAIEKAAPESCIAETQDFDSETISLRLGQSFYNRSCLELAKSLLGKILVRKLDSGEILKAKVIETECYLGFEDKASHSYNGRRSERNEPMFMAPGTVYVYMTYGMYYIFNISSQGEGAAVLLRSLEPLQNASTMLKFRSSGKRKNPSALKEKDLCNGPGKLCQAFKIEKDILNKTNMATSHAMWIEDESEIPDCDIITCKRIGIDSVGEEWANKPLRFYIKDSKFVSVRNKVAERLHDENF